MKDYQQSACYKWESYLPEGERIRFKKIQAYVDHVWSDMGLEYPPRVEVMPKHTKRWLGQANRMKLWFPTDGASEKTILHELAHCMTMNVDGVGHQHNKYFVGMYIVLLNKYMMINIFMLWYSAEKHRVEYEKWMTPRVTDEHKVLYG